MQSLLQFPEYDNVYCRYTYVYGHDWDISSVSDNSVNFTLSYSLHMWCKVASDKIRINIYLEKRLNVSPFLPHVPF